MKVHALSHLFRVFRFFKRPSRDNGYANFFVKSVVPILFYGFP